MIYGVDATAPAVKHVRAVRLYTIRMFDMQKVDSMVRSVLRTSRSDQIVDIDMSGSSTLSERCDLPRNSRQPGDLLNFIHSQSVPPTICIALEACDPVCQHTILPWNFEGTMHGL